MKTLDQAAVPGSCNLSWRTIRRFLAAKSTLAWRSPCAFLWLSTAIIQLATLEPQQCVAAVFTTDFTISETDTSYDGQDIVVRGAPLTINGLHAFNSLLRTNGSVLAHSACAAIETHKLDQLDSNAFMLDAVTEALLGQKSMAAETALGSTGTRNHASPSGQSKLLAGTSRMGFALRDLRVPKIVPSGLIEISTVEEERKEYA